MLHSCKIKKAGILITFAILLLLSFLFINLGTGLLFGNYKADFTAGKKYTLSPATENILKDIKAPVYIKLYLSSNLGGEYPQYANYAQFVLHFLSKYQSLSDGAVQLEVRNPEPYSDIENEAKNAKIKPVLDNEGQTNLYFGAVISNEAGDSYTIPNFIPMRNSKLEEDISRIIDRINNPLPVTVGLIAPNLPVWGQQYGVSDQKKWDFLSVLQNNYNVVQLSDKTIQVPLNIDVLVLVNPQRLFDSFAYALDQYILRGGKLVIFIDPYSETEGSFRGTSNISSPQFQPLLNNWGIRYAENLVVGDSSLSQKMLINDGSKTQMKEFYPWMQITEKYINQKHPITESLQRINVRSAGTLEGIPSEDISITPLLSTSKKGGSIDAEIAKIADKNEVLSLYQQDKKAYNLALLVEGTFTSLYNSNIYGNAGYASNMLPYLAVSAQPGAIVAITDTDMLSDENWADNDYIDSNPVYGIIPEADNAGFLVRTIDYLAGHHNLLGLHNRYGLGNPRSIGDKIHAGVFERYADDYTDAQQQLSAKQQELAATTAAVENGKIAVSMKIVENLDKMRQEIAAAQEKIKRLDYQIKRENENRVSGVIVLNTLLIPLGMIFLLWFINLILTRRQKRKIMELVHEHKNS